MKNESLYRIFKGEFAGNVFTLAMSTTLAQGLIFAAVPFLTRLYLPSDFGILAMFMSIATTLGVVSCWGYELSIVLPEKDEDAVNVMALSFFITAGMSLLALIIISFYRNTVAEYLDMPALATWLLLVPVSLFAYGSYQSLNYWSTRKKLFNRLAISRVAQSVTAVTTQLVTGILKYGAGGLVVGRVAGQWMAAALIGTRVFREDRSIFFKNVQLKEMKKQGVRYKKFPFYTAPLGLLNTISDEIPVLMLGYFFGPVIVGLYAITRRVLIVPMALVGQSIAQVFFPKAVEEQRSGGLSKLMQKAFIKLFLLSFVPAVLLIISAPDLFSVAFGPDWREAGYYARWLLPFFFLQFLSSPLSQIFFVLERQKSLLIWNLLLLIFRVLSIVIGGWLYNPLTTIMLLGLTGFVFYSMIIILLFRLTGINIQNLISEIKIYLYIGLPLLTSIFFAYINIDNVTTRVLLFCFSLLFYFSTIAYKFSR